MGVRILEGENQEGAVFYCSTTGWAFGPLFNDREDAECFLDWLDRWANPPLDPRSIKPHDLEAYFDRYRKDNHDG